jgi:hypothetical protein
MKKLLIILSIFTGLLSCTDLDEDVYTEIVNDNFFKTEKQVLAAAGPAYSNLRAYPNPENVWGLNSLTTDEMLIPTRGIHWYNDGIYQRFHKHEWVPTEFIIGNAWRFIYVNVNNCNRLIYQLEQVENKSDALISVMKELRGLRAFFYYHGIDLFGNIPLYDRYDVPEEYAPPTVTRQEIFDFLETELIESIPDLNDAVDMTTYGRFHRWAAYTLQAKLYLNAEVYTGQPMWDECIAACDSIINSGNYSLEDEYFDNFIINNEGSNENIFVIPFDNTQPVDWGGDGMSVRMFEFHFWTLHFNGNQAFGMTQGGWDGMCAVPSFIRSYDTLDYRYNQWLIGLQLSTTGDTLRCNQEKNGEPLIYTIDVTSLEAAGENEGARLAKYDYTGAENWTLSNDFVVFRYADVLLMKAEALMRKNGGVATQQAVDLVNQVRARAFPGDASKLYTTSTLTLDAMLAERGWEFAGEGYRRTDLVRFGKFNDALDFRPVPATSTYNIFPIPQEQINANPNLTQNPGYD